MSSPSQATAPDTFLVASEVLPPSGRGAPPAAAAIRSHQKRATELAQARGGAILVRVGRGCIAAFPTPEAALRMATRLVTLERRTSAGSPAQVRAALHLGRLSQQPTPLAEPEVALVRGLLERAGPGEIVLSDPLYRTLPDPRPQTTAIGHAALRADSASTQIAPAAHRLLYLPELPADSTSSPLRSGWLVGGTVALAVLLCVGILALGLMR